LPSTAEWNKFYDSMLAGSGLNLYEYKAPQLQRRTVNMMETQGFRSLTQFWDWIAQDKMNLQWYMDKLAINVSELFRNPERWADMEKQILPELLQKKSRLKIWSAGCSYGAEAYTLAMILQEKFPGVHEIVGTDIDEEAMNQAKRAEFSESDVRYIPDDFKKYVSEIEKDKWKADDILRRHLKFKRHNLLADRFDRNFDLIMCRNVVIYFTDEAKDVLYRRFFDALRPGGILFVGGTERINKSDEMGYETALPFYYRKPTLGVNTWQNAS